MRDFSEPDDGNCREAQGRSREARSEGSVERSCDLTNRNRIQGVCSRTSKPMIAKSKVIKDCMRRSGKDAAKAVELTPGDLHRVAENRD